MVLLLAPNVWAFDGIVSEEKSGWTIIPALRFSQFYTDNVDLDPSGQQRTSYLSAGTFALHVMNPPALREKSFSKGGRRFLLDIDARCEGVYYTYGRKGVRPAMTLKSAYFSGTGIKVGFSDNVYVTDDPANNELTNLRTRADNNLDFSILYRRAKLGVSVGYKNNIRYYFDSDSMAQDRMEHLPSVSVIFAITPKTDIIAEYSYGIMNYEEIVGAHSNSHYQQVQGGLKLSPTPKIDISLKAGYERRDYDDPTGGDFSGWVGSLVAKWDIIRGSSRLTLNVLRDIIDSTYQPNNYYISTGGTVAFLQCIGDRWKLSVNGMYDVDSYPEDTPYNGTTKKRRDQVWRASANLYYYIIKGLSLGAGFSHRERDSNMNNFDYKENRVNIINLSAIL